MTLVIVKCRSVIRVLARQRTNRKRLDELLDNSVQFARARHVIRTVHRHAVDEAVACRRTAEHARFDAAYDAAGHLDGLDLVEASKCVGLEMGYLKVDDVQASHVAEVAKGVGVEAKLAVAAARAVDGEGPDVGDVTEDARGEQEGGARREDNDEADDVIRVVESVGGQDGQLVVDEREQVETTHGAEGTVRGGADDIV